MKTVRPTYVLVANRVAGDLFRTQGPHVPVELVAHFDHPEGRLKAHDIDSDRPGRAFDRQGGGRHALSKEESPVERETHEFVLRLAHELEHARQRGDFDQLALIAPPRMLGQLRAALSDQTRALVYAEITKDLDAPDGATVRKCLDERA